MNALVWHYTTGEYAAKIIASWRIEPATAFVFPPEKPVVWFSRNQIWEPTACKGGFDSAGRNFTWTTEQMDAELGGLFRFGLEPDGLLRWADVIRAARIRTAKARALERAGREVGALPSDWLGSLEPISLDRGLCFQQRIRGAWENVQEIQESGASR